MSETRVSGKARTNSRSKTPAKARKSTTASAPRKASSKTPATNKPARASAKTNKADIAKKPVAIATGVSVQSSDSGRHQIIATMAYYRAEARGFESGWELKDWLECERTVELQSRESAGA